MRLFWDSPERECVGTVNRFCLRAAGVGSAPRGRPDRMCVVTEQPWRDWQENKQTKLQRERWRAANTSRAAQAEGRAFLRKNGLDAFVVEVGCWLALLARLGAPPPR